MSGSPDEGFERHVHRAADLDSVTRSTVPLLAWWRDHAASWAIPGTVDPRVTMEHEVSADCASCGSRGKGSFSDVMVRDEAKTIAFEAKYTEPRYEQVDAWRTRGSSPENRTRVLAHWCHLIEAHTQLRIDREALSPLVYQVLHRTASACAVAADATPAEVTYLLFDDGSRDLEHYEADLQRAASVLDPAGAIEFSILRVPTRRGPGFSAARDLCAKAATGEDRAQIVRRALLARELYVFPDSPERLVIEGR